MSWLFSNWLSESHHVLTSSGLVPGDGSLRGSPSVPGGVSGTGPPIAAWMAAAVWASI